MKIFSAVSMLVLFSVTAFFHCRQEKKAPERTPNIVILYADDLGFGDLSCYGATEISTPGIDRIADEGLRFTNAYATSATCTPSRYALLTGEYPWRNTRASVLPGNAPLIIDPDRPNLPRMLKMAGYTTGVVGKWHLGLGGENLDWNREIHPGPNDLGFDYSYILASTNDRVPTVFLENGRVAGLDPEDPLEVNYQENFPGEPTGRDNPELLKMFPSHGHDMSINNGISRIGYMRGGKSALWIDENMADTILVKAKTFIRGNSDHPFFLFYAFHQPHVPRVPGPEFVGATDMGPRGDVIMEIDYAVSEILQLLDELGIDEETLVVFSSDNGPVLDDGYQDEAVTRIGHHKPAGILRGGKYSLFDAGTHLPFMIRWPLHVSPGISDALVCQIDLAASFAAMTGQENPNPDSRNIMDALLGRSRTGRENLVLEASRRTCLREGDWVMIPPYNGPPVFENVHIESGLSSVYQLYNLSADPSQAHNLAEENPEKLQEMIKTYQEIVK